MLVCSRAALHWAGRQGSACSEAGGETAALSSLLWGSLPGAESSRCTGRNACRAQWVASTAMPAVLLQSLEAANRDVTAELEARWAAVDRFLVATGNTCLFAALLFAVEYRLF